MTLLFIENRHKTYFLQPIAEKLSHEGHKVHWIVQNRTFAPQGNFTIHKIKYPKRKQLNGFSKDKSVEDVIESDRQINHFRKDDVSYFYYYNEQIKQLIETIQPGIVFGEATAFHELLVINNCRKSDILYLNPSTCRYPVGRFSFYKYDTLEPFCGSREKLSNNEAIVVIDQIVQRKAVPDYMKIQPSSKIEKIRDQLRKAYAYFDGERYNTPNPFIKHRIEKQHAARIEKWDTISVENIITNSTCKVLYPLQMQPEANIDVWGRKHRNQSKLIQEISKNIPENAVLYVKPNPKSKYELDDELYNIVSTTKNIVVLNHKTKMDDIIAHIDLVITVTGTIAIECILNNKPIISLIETVNNKAKNCTYIDSMSVLPSEIEKVRNREFAYITDQEKIDFINLLNATSYKGIISDPFTDLNCISDDNMRNVISAFNNVMKAKENV